MRMPLAPLALIASVSLAAPEKAPSDLPDNMDAFEDDVTSNPAPARSPPRAAAPAPRSEDPIDTDHLSPALVPSEGQSRGPASPPPDLEEP